MNTITDSFEDWARDSRIACIVKYRERLAEIGVTWETFQRPEEEVVSDLLEAGFPSREAPSRFAARDVVAVARRELDAFQAREHTPLAIFWDMENVALPTASRPQDVVTMLKTKLRPFGSITQIRAYCSVTQQFGTNEERRSELQLSGVHVVDTPHNKRKEVADKMIIVDAMEFAYDHLDGAVLVIITGDTDFAYLLARLQRRSQWRTILIGKGTLRTMLHVNATMSMRWETDILGMRERAFNTPVLRTPLLPFPATMRSVRGAPRSPSAAARGDSPFRNSGHSRSQSAGRDPSSSTVPEWIDAAALEQTLLRGAGNTTTTNATATTPTAEQQQGAPGDASKAPTQQLPSFMNVADMAPYVENDDDDAGMSHFHTAELETLTEHEALADDFALLLHIIRQEQTEKGRQEVLKADVGRLLRERNPLRFPNRDTVREFLNAAVEPQNGVVVESGEGATKRLRPRAPAEHSSRPMLQAPSSTSSVHTAAPASGEGAPLLDLEIRQRVPAYVLDNMTDRAKQVARTRRYIFVLPKSFAVPTSITQVFSDQRCFVQSGKQRQGLYVMLENYTAARRLAALVPTLRHPSVLFFNFLEVAIDQAAAAPSPAPPPASPPATHPQPDARPAVAVNQGAPAAVAGADSDELPEIVKS